MTFLRRWPGRTGASLYVPAVLAAGIVIGVGSWLTFDTVLHATGTTEFCGTSCHSHAAFIYPDHQQSVHYANASGTRASCSDCHIPHEFLPKLYVKAKAGTYDAYAEYVKGTISTREKYEQELPRLYEHVRATMKANDSKACRSCHDFTPAVLQTQAPEAAKNHAEYRQRGQTCIDCHKGVAHSVPGLPRLGSDDAAPAVGVEPVASAEPLAEKLGCLACHGVSAARTAPGLVELSGELRAKSDTAQIEGKPAACKGSPSAPVAADDLARIADWTLWLSASQARRSAAAR